MKSKSISNPKGRPEIIATRDLPCDSPAVTKSNIIGNISPDLGVRKFFVPEMDVLPA
jgi:hypothetical protein